jgi:cation:H+ antiporter
MMITLMLVAGLMALYFGAEWLVRGGSSLAVRLGVTPLLVGLTVVAYGTSMPESIVSSMAAAKGQGAIAIGNVVGSNIFNILAILGASGVIAPPLNGQGVSLTDTVVMIGISLVLFLQRQVW